MSLVGWYKVVHLHSETSSPISKEEQHHTRKPQGQEKQWQPTTLLDTAIVLFSQKFKLTDYFIHFCLESMESWY